MLITKALKMKTMECTGNTEGQRKEVCINKSQYLHTAQIWCTHWLLCNYLKYNKNYRNKIHKVCV
jgi:hypothetical protein